MLDHDDFRPDNSPEQPEEPARRRSGGPHTPHGKLHSSQNACTHGCRSHIRILPTEDPQELADLHQRWEDAYQPDSAAACELLEQFVLNKWYLLRAERHFDEVQLELSHSPFTTWDDKQHKTCQLALRYKTSAERSASKAQRDLEDFLKNRRNDEKFRQQLSARNHATVNDLAKSMLQQEQSMAQSITDAAALGLDPHALRTELAALQQHNRATLASRRADIAALDANKSRAQILFQGQTSPKKLRQIHVLEQWVEVTVRDGVTRTELTPSNEKLIERGQSMDPPPSLVYRRLHFPHGIPDEYDWTTDDPLLKQYGGFGLQRMHVDTWLDLLPAEQLRPDGHIGPCGDPLPRPKERGSCDCPACHHNRSRLLSHPATRPGTP